jgi:hypothetical protein
MAVVETAEAAVDVAARAGAGSRSNTIPPLNSCTWLAAFAELLSVPMSTKCPSEQSVENARHMP